MPFPYPNGSVYILENTIAQRVKVGTTSIGISDVGDRLKDVNDMWFERKITCQVCGGRLINLMGLVPQHFKCGVECHGGNALPIEKEVTLAKIQLDKLKISLLDLAGVEKFSVTRMIRTLEKRIEKYSNYNQPAGIWEFRIAYYVEGAAKAEAAAHRILAENLDATAPFGEVFSCSVLEARVAVETALKDLGLFDLAKVKYHL